MTSFHPQSAASGGRRTRPRALLPFLGIALAILPATVAVAASATSAPPRATREAGRLDSSLSRVAKLAGGQVRPAARQLAQGLPAALQRVQALREPASTTQAQVKIAFDELRQMSAPATLDPHYSAALVAAGRAFVAASGQDPLTRTTINPDYLGLETELAASEAELAGSAGEASRLSTRVRQLTKALSRTKRRAHRLARLLIRGGAATGAGR
ncbi:MAG: hypothetical protein ACM3JL_01190 [Nitrososphaerota archaeon]